MKHTPGPWNIYNYKDELRIFGQPNNRNVAKVELDSDARLIAAAPEMLEQLKNAREYIKSLLDAEPDEAIDFLTNNGEQVESDLEIVILKAEGK